MQAPLMRIPFTGPLPAPRIIPRTANTTQGAIAALTAFLTHDTRPTSNRSSKKTLILSGAGVSVASGLADYRGVNGTYTLNKNYRPIYFHEFVASHEARKRYWARSFLGWTVLEKARPNDAHVAVGKLGEMGVVGGVITQNVDSLHTLVHPRLSTLPLHGSLATLICLSCHTHLPRSTFQSSLDKLNPTWSSFLHSALSSGALTTENPAERNRLGMKTNPDGDVDLQGTSYATFRYPACPTCFATPPKLPNGEKARVEVDADGAWLPSSTAGVLKPSVIMFGESIPENVKRKAERMVDESGKVLVLGSSLATYSAFRLVKLAKEKGKGVGVVNMGGVRGEEGFFQGDEGIRIDMEVGKVLPGVIERLKEMR